MPQMNKGGKFIFGKSVIQSGGTVQLPPQAVEEYRIAREGAVYLFTGSKITGGFCIHQSWGTFWTSFPNCSITPQRPENSSNTRAAPTAGRPSPKKGKFT